MPSLFLNSHAQWSYLFLYLFAIVVVSDILPALSTDAICKYPYSLLIEILSDVVSVLFCNVTFVSLLLSYKYLYPFIPVVTVDVITFDSSIGVLVLLFAYASILCLYVVPLSVALK